MPNDTHNRLRDAIAEQPEARRRHFAPPFTPNSELDRLLLRPEIAVTVMTPLLRMSLG